MKYPTNKIGREGFTDAAGCGNFRDAETVACTAITADRVSFPIASLAVPARSQQPVQPQGGIFLSAPHQHCTNCGWSIDQDAALPHVCPVETPEPFNDRTWPEFLKTEQGRWLAGALGWEPTVKREGQATPQPAAPGREPRKKGGGFMGGITV